MKKFTHNSIKGLATFVGTYAYEMKNNILLKGCQQNPRMGPVPLQGIHEQEVPSILAIRRKIQNPVMGFSLIELMVSLTIFSIVMTISLGTLLTLIDANTKAQALSSSMTNISFALDSISRNLRTGRDFHCAFDGADVESTSENLLHSTSLMNPQECTNGYGRAIIFTPGLDSDLRVGYRLHDSQLEQWVDEDNNDDEWVPITSNEPPGAVTITVFSLTVEGADSGDEIQPQISLLIEGEVDAGLSEPTEFRVQTNITQRILNY